MVILVLQDLREEQLGAIVLRIVEQSLGGGVLDDQPRSYGTICTSPPPSKFEPPPPTQMASY